MSAIDKIKNKAEEIVGEVKEKVGDLTNNDSLRAEGQADQTKAAAKDAGENVKDTASDVKDAFKR